MNSVGRWPLPVLLFISYGLSLVVLSVFKSAEIFLPQIYALEHWLGGDKWMHFKLSAMLAVLTCFASERVLDLAPFRRILVATLCLALALSIDEALQGVFASRRFELADLAYGCSGVLAGVVGYLAVVWVKTGRMAG